ncbi:hypothetical protein CUS46_00760 [Enterococcus faecium]|nr:hypothetical protein CUS46_00760 [Enterococcus faecium]
MYIFCTFNRLLDRAVNFSHSFTIFFFLLKIAPPSRKKEIFGKNFQSSRNSKNPHPKISSLKKPKNIRIMNLSYGTRLVVSVISRRVLPTPFGFYFALFSRFL